MVGLACGLAFESAFGLAPGLASVSAAGLAPGLALAVKNVRQTLIRGLVLVVQSFGLRTEPSHGRRDRVVVHKHEMGLS